MTPKLDYQWRSSLASKALVQLLIACCAQWTFINTLDRGVAPMNWSNSQHPSWSQDVVHDATDAYREKVSSTPYLTAPFLRTAVR